MALRVAVSLAAVLGVLWYLQRRLTRKSGRQAEPETITVVGRQGLGAKTQLVVVDSGGVRYVLGVSEHGVTVVDRIAPGGANATNDVASSGSESETAQGSEQNAAPVEFARLLEASEEHRGEHIPDRRVRTRSRRDPLRGSILSPDTWRQSADALRRSR